MGVGAGLYMCDVVVKSSRSLSNLLLSSRSYSCAAVGKILTNASRGPSATP